MSDSIDTELLSDSGPRPRPAPPPPPRLNRLFDRILVVCFVLAIVIPFLGTWFHWDRALLNEKRVLSPFPRAPHSFKEATHYTDNFLNYFSDHFGFRQALIRDFNDFRYHAGELAWNDRVIVGKNGWLFLRLGGGSNPNPSFTLERGFRHFTEPELDAWQDALERRAAYCQAHGAVYLCVIAPEKQSIYPELMPDDLAPRGPSRIDELADRLSRTHSPVHFIDLRPALRAAKSTGELYRRTDSHWNDEGAWIGYQVILAAMQRELPAFHLAPQPKSDFELWDAGMKSGDLVGLLGVDNVIQERWIKLVRRVPFNNGEGDPGTLEYDLHNPALPRVVMYHDSFTQLLIPMLGPHFGHAYFGLNRPLDAATIVAQKPDIVITETVERMLYQPPVADSPEIETMPLRPR